MEIFTKKKFWVKLLISLMAVITIYNFSAPTFVSADPGGGLLFAPVNSLFTILGDAMMYLIQHGLFGLNIIHINLYHPGKTVLGFIAIALGVIGTVALTILTGGAYLGLIAATIAIGCGLGYKAIIDILPDDYILPVFAVGPEQIFTNSIGMLDINFFEKNKKTTTIKDEHGNETVVSEEIISVLGKAYKNPSAAATLRPIITKWYAALRNFAIVALMIILMYIGIRIILSSTGKDKAKYKDRLVDWLIAMCLLFFMHYIMYFSVYVVSKITDGLNTTINWPVLTVPVSKIEPEGYVAKDPTLGIAAPEENGLDVIRRHNAIQVIDGEEHIVWPTNLAGIARHNIEVTDGAKSFAQVIIYCVAVMYTVMFLVTYLKRVIYMTFLTMIAPLVAMTYPLDKIHDGNAQAFNLWLKEYLFNLLIQPFHLIIYTIIVTSVMSFAINAPIYALVAMGFMLQAEKLMRRFFGFDKAQTASSTSAALGGAVAMQAVNKLRHMGPSGRHSGGKNGGDEKDNSKNTRIRDASKIATIESANFEQADNRNNIPENNDFSHMDGQYDGDERSLQAQQEQQQQYNRQTQGEGYSHMDGQYGGNEGSLHDQQDENNDDSNKESNSGGNTAKTQNSVRFNRKKDKNNVDEFELAKKKARRKAAGQVWGDVGKRVAKGVGNFALKAPGRLFGGLVGAGLATMATMASGKDLEDNVKDSLMGAGAGLAFGGKLSTNVDAISRNAKNEKKMKEERIIENLQHQKKEYADAYQDELADRATMEDKELRKKIEDDYVEELKGKDKKGKEDFIDKKIKSVIEYQKAGVSDNKIILKTMKMDDKMFGGAEEVTSQKKTLARLAQQRKRGVSRREISDSLIDNNVSDRARVHILNTIDNKLVKDKDRK